MSMSLGCKARRACFTFFSLVCCEGGLNSLLNLLKQRCAECPGFQQSWQTVLKVFRASNHFSSILTNCKGVFEAVEPISSVFSNSVSRLYCSRSKTSIPEGNFELVYFVLPLFATNAAYGIFIGEFSSKILFS